MAGATPAYLWLADPGAPAIRRRGGKRPRSKASCDGESCQGTGVGSSERPPCSFQRRLLPPSAQTKTTADGGGCQGRRSRRAERGQPWCARHGHRAGGDRMT
jgi:hypothetical protein